MQTTNFVHDDLRDCLIPSSRKLAHHHFNASHVMLSIPQQLSVPFRFDLGSWKQSLTLFLRFVPQLIANFFFFFF